MLLTHALLDSACLCCPSTESWTADPLVALPIRVAESGPAAAPPVTVPQLFDETVARCSMVPALCTEESETAWKTVTWGEFGALVHRAARALVGLGVERGSGVAILGFNSVEWLVADIAAIFAGAIAAGIYTTNGPEACQYVIDHCRARIVFVEDNKLAARVLSIKDQCPRLVHVVVWKEAEPIAGTMSWAQFMASGEEVTDEAVKAISDSLQPGHCATLIYTSGTTGNPKAAMASHDNLTWTARVAWGVLQQTAGSVSLSYLPLSHIAAQMLDIYGPMVAGGTVYFARPDALKGSLGASLKRVRPTLFLGVPRVWEKMQEKMIQLGSQTVGLKRTFADWAKKKGLQGNYNRQRGESEPWGWFMATFVFDKVKEALGLDRCTIRATGAAPISLETLEYFMSLDLSIMEVYGMSETSGLISMSMPSRYRTRSCGFVMPGTELKLVPKEGYEPGNGEICSRGRQVFNGYMYDEAKTAETFDEEGFIKTGDVGKMDEDGFLYITGRIKELLITAGGENVAPVPIEDAVKSLLPFVSNAVAIGDKKKFLSILLTLKVEVDPDTGAPTHNLTAAAQADLARVGVQAATVDDAMANPALDTAIRAGIETYNRNAVSNAQRLQKHAVLPEDLSVAGDELTSTLKIKRRVVNDKWAHVIDALYAEPAGGAN